LKPLKNEKYKTEADFRTALEKVLNSDFMTKYHTLILKNTQTAGKFNGESYVEFLKQLLQHFEGKIRLVPK